MTGRFGYGLGSAIVAALLGLSLAVGVVLAIDWVIWQAWLYVLPALWPFGPRSLLYPDFWVFAIAFFLLGCIGRALRPNKPT